jgi:hypothetical protein
MAFKATCSHFNVSSSIEVDEAGELATILVIVAISSAESD